MDIKRDFGATTADANWRLGSWSSTTGYPSIGTFYQERMFAGNNTDQPQTVWASQTADFENFSPDSDPSTTDIFDGTVEDDDAFTSTISADDVNAIFWMNSGENVLAIGTSGGIWVPESTGSVLTPSDFSFNRQVTSQAAQIQPVRVDSVVLYVQRAKRKVREFGFSFENDGYQSIDMTRLAQHITIGGIIEMDFAEEPDSDTWVIRNDGVLLSMTFRRQEDVVGWARHILGGRFVGGNTLTATDISFTTTNTISSVAGAFGDFVEGDELFIDGSTSNDFGDIGLVTVASVSSDGLTITIEEATIVTESAGSTITITAMSDSVVESLAVIPGADGSGQVHDSTKRDEVWLLVKRTINGSTVRYIEVLERSFEDGDDQEDAYNVDSLLTYDSTATTAITGLSHLEGETVKIWADGGVVADKTVSSGAITLDSSASVVQIGLGYTHIFKGLKLEGGNPVGTSVGKTKRIDKITFVVLNSHGITWGPSMDSIQETDVRVVSDPMDSPAPLFTGERTLEFQGNWESDPRIWIVSDDPSPFTLLAIAPEDTINPLS